MPLKLIFLLAPANYGNLEGRYVTEEEYDAMVEKHMKIVLKTVKLFIRITFFKISKRFF